jgi:transcriptional regulator with XRE-family HTH domain
MTEIQQLIATIKRALRARGLAYRDVAKALGLSEPSVKRMFASGNLSLARLARVADLLGLSLAELTQQAAASVPKISALSVDQEAELVDDVRLLLVAACALNHWTLGDIVAHYRFDEAECLRSLLRLDRMRLIDLLPGNRIRVNVARDFDWLPDGPIRRYFRARGEADFLAERFARDDETLFFAHGMLTAEAIAQFQTQLRQLRKRFAALHDESQDAPIGTRRGMGLLLAMREWEPPDFAAQRRPGDGHGTPWETRQ